MSIIDEIHQPFGPERERWLASIQPRPQPRVLNAAERQEAEAEAKRRHERSAQTAALFYASQFEQRPPPTPRPLTESEPVPEIRNLLDVARISTLITTISESGVAIGREKLEEISQNLRSELAALDDYLGLTLRKGRSLNFADWSDVRALLNQLGISDEIGSFSDCWRLDGARRKLFERWVSASALELANRLALLADESGRVHWPLFTSALAKTPFDDWSVRLFLRYLTSAIAAPPERELVLVELPMLLPSLAAWASRDPALAAAVENDDLFEHRDTPVIDITGPADRFKIYGQVARRQSQAHVVSWLLGYESPASIEFLGNNFGLLFSADAARFARGELARRFVTAQRFINRNREAFVRPLEDRDLDEQYRAKFGRFDRPTMGRFDTAAFCAANQKQFADLRAVANTKVAGGLTSSLGSEAKIIAAIRDSVLIEVPAGSAETLGPELVQAARTALLDSFADLRCVVSFGTGQSWADAASDLERRLVAGLPNDRKIKEQESASERVDPYPHLRQAAPWPIPDEAAAREIARKGKKGA